MDRNLNATDQGSWRQLASLLPSPITVLDIGARAGIGDEWTVFGEHVRAYGFDPDAVECERLSQGSDQNVQYVPVAIGGSTGQQRFYVTQDPFCSSLYAPVERLARERPRLAGLRTQEIVAVETQTVDDWVRDNHIGRVDYLKLDVQGAELLVLEGSERALAAVRAVKLEVQFSQLYEESALFGEVDQFLRAHAFELWRLSELSHCSIDEAGLAVTVPEIFDYDSRRIEVSACGGQLLWANAYYVRRESTRPAQRIRWDDAIRDACLAKAHHYHDLAELSVRRALADAPSQARAALAAYVVAS